MEDLTQIIAILTTIGLPVVLGMYIAIRSGIQKHKENMELIKQGIMPSDKKSSPPSKYRSLRNGFLILGIGIGLIVGFLVGNSMNLPDEHLFWAIAAGILIFLGIAYIAFYLLVQHKDFNEE